MRILVKKIFFFSLLVFCFSSASSENLTSGFFDDDSVVFIDSEKEKDRYYEYLESGKMFSRVNESIQTKYELAILSLMDKSVSYDGKVMKVFFMKKELHCKEFFSTKANYVLYFVGKEKRDNRLSYYNRKGSYGVFYSCLFDDDVSLVNFDITKIDFNTGSFNHITAFPMFGTRDGNQINTVDLNIYIKYGNLDFKKSYVNDALTLKGSIDNYINSSGYLYYDFNVYDFENWMNGDYLQKTISITYLSYFYLLGEIIRMNNKIKGITENKAIDKIRKKRSEKIKLANDAMETIRILFSIIQYGHSLDITNKKDKSIIIKEDKELARFVYEKGLGSKDVKEKFYKIKEKLESSL